MIGPRPRVLLTPPLVPRDHEDVQGINCVSGYTVPNVLKECLEQITQ